MISTRSLGKNNHGFHWIFLPTPWGIFLSPSLSRFTTIQPFTKTQSSRLYCISCHSSTRIPRPNQWQPPLGFTIYPTIHQQIFLEPPRQCNPGFTSTHSLTQGSLGQWLSCDPQSGSGTTRPRALSFEDPSHSASNPFDNLAQPKHENPITPCLSKNGNVKPKKLSHLEKPMP